MSERIGDIIRNGVGAAIDELDVPLTRLAEHPLSNERVHSAHCGIAAARALLEKALDDIGPAPEDTDE